MKKPKLIHLHIKSAWINALHGNLAFYDPNAFLFGSLERSRFGGEASVFKISATKLEIFELIEQTNSIKNNTVKYPNKTGNEYNRLLELKRYLIEMLEKYEDN